jgi:hypothetical protein
MGALNQQNLLKKPFAHRSTSFASLRCNCDHPDEKAGADRPFPWRA